MLRRVFQKSQRILCRRTYSQAHDVSEALERTVGAGQVSLGQSVREQHGKDESYHSCHPPDVVVFPHTVEEVSAICKVCTEKKVPIVPFGTGTGMEGGTVCLEGGVSVDLTKMDQVTAYHPEDFDVTVQPGVRRLTLNDYIKGEGLWFPIDPGADASLCGMAATCASGTNAVKYGTMKENVMNLEVVLADGSVIHTAGEGRRTRKSAAGYNLTGLFVGSEGTLGLITKATLRLQGIPESMVSAVCHFESVKAAVDTTTQILQSGIPVARVELMDEVMMMATNKYSSLNYEEKPSLFFEFHGDTAGTEYQAKLAEEIVVANDGFKFQWASDLTERNKLWRARHNALYACLALRPGCTQMSTDVCVPISNLTEIVTKTKETIASYGLVAPVLGHVGDGNFHVTLLFDSESEEEKKAIHEVSAKIARMSLELNGTCTGEHGIGIGKRKYLLEEMGEANIQVMKSLKRTLDPLGIMNPGKVLPAFRFQEMTNRVDQDWRTL